MKTTFLHKLTRAERSLLRSAGINKARVLDTKWHNGRPTSVFIDGFDEFGDRWQGWWHEGDLATEINWTRAA